LALTPKECLTKDRFVGQAVPDPEALAAGAPARRDAAVRAIKAPAVAVLRENEFMVSLDAAELGHKGRQSSCSMMFWSASTKTG
jgi:hypothetical protein